MTFNEANKSLRKTGAARAEGDSLIVCYADVVAMKFEFLVMAQKKTFAPKVFEWAKAHNINLLEVLKNWPEENPWPLWNAIMDNKPL